MRIRMLAAAVVTAGALMTTLTGAASADGTPTPAPEEGVTHIRCEGGGEAILMTRRLTDAEIEELGKAGSVPAVPAVPSAAGGTEAGDIRVFERAPGEKPGVREFSSLPEGVVPAERIKITGSTAPQGVAEPGVAAPLSVAGSVPDGAEATRVKVMGTLSGDAHTITCARAQ